MTRPIDPKISREDVSDEHSFGRKAILSKFRLPRIDAPILVLAGGLVLVFFLFILFGSGDGQRQDSGLSPEVIAQFDQLTERLDRIEIALTSLEERVDTDPMATEKTRVAMNRLSDTVVTRLARMERKVDALAKARTVAAKPAISPRPTRVETPPIKSVQVRKAALTTVATVRVHTVRKGDTLFGIARKYKVGVAQIRKANGLTQKGVLHPGQKLTIP